MQFQFLMNRIRRCENTAYGRDNGFKSMQRPADFLRNHPITDYSTMESYVDRMTDGEKSALLGDEDGIFMFIATSGTTGKSKKIPMSDQGAKAMQSHLLYGPYRWAVQRDVAPWNLKRMMSVNNGRTVQHTKSGHVLDVASTVFYSKAMALFAPLYASPVISLHVKHEFESQYIHMLFGLRDKHITMIGTVFVHNFLSMMHRMEVFQNDLVNDVRRGRIKDNLDLSGNVRAQLNAQLTPMPGRAEEIKNEFAKGFKGIIPRLWPDVRSISGLCSGSTNEVYYKEAKALTGPDVPIVSFTYTASEGFMGSNLECTRSGSPRYTLIPDIMFFEFLPIVNDRILDLDEINPKDLLLSEQLELNKTYEVIITNSSGFYRFRLGDVVRVVGFHQQAPQIEFLYRSSQSLNVNGEKLSEEVFYRALRQAADRWPSALKDYAVAGSQFAPSHQGLLDPHYLLFLELDGPALTDEQTGLVDDILRQLVEEYASFRKLEKIAKIQVYQVQPGTFSRFREHLLASLALTAGQFKMPRVVKSRDRVDWFLKNVHD